MNRRGQIGQILTSFPSIIFVFVIMLIFVIVSGFISKNNELNENLLDDFMSDYILFEGKVVTVREAFDEECKTFTGQEWLNDKLRIALIDEFKIEYGSEYSFVLSKTGSTDIYAVYGVFEKEMKETDEANKGIVDIKSRKILRVSLDKFNMAFPPKSQNYDYARLCSGWEIHMKRGVEI